jgi:hypothetical protein
MRDIKLFESKKVRTHWDETKETWFFSVIDVIEILTGSSIPKRYWTDLKKKLIKEGSQMYENIVQLKFETTDKKYAVFPNTIAATYKMTKVGIQVYGKIVRLKLQTEDGKNLMHIFVWKQILNFSYFLKPNHKPCPSITVSF